jgi:hypothetical protein
MLRSLGSRALGSRAPRGDLGFGPVGRTGQKWKSYPAAEQGEQQQ